MPYTVAWCSLTQKHNCTWQQHKPRWLWSVCLLELYFPASLLFIRKLWSAVPPVNTAPCSAVVVHSDQLAAPHGDSLITVQVTCVGHEFRMCSPNKELPLSVGFSWLWLATVSLLAHGSVSWGARGPRVWLELRLRSRGGGAELQDQVRSVWQQGIQYEDNLQRHWQDYYVRCEDTH